MRPIRFSRCSAPHPVVGERRFSTLTAAQIARITAHGRRRAVAPGEVLVEVEDKTVPIFVVIGDDAQALRPSAGAGALIVTFVPGQFSGEGNMLDHDPDMQALLGQFHVSEFNALRVARRAGESTLTG